MKSISTCVNASGQYFKRLAGKIQSATVNDGSGYAGKYDFTEGLTWAKVEEAYFARKSGSGAAELEFNKAA